MNLNFTSLGVVVCGAVGADFVITTTAREHKMVHLDLLFAALAVPHDEAHRDFARGQSVMSGTVQFVLVLNTKQMII